MKKNNKKSKLLNNKGFSMIEILAVVVILAVVSTIGIVSVTRIVDASKKHFYDSQQDQMVLAARAYAGDNRAILPRMIGQRTEVKLEKLYEKNYIKETIKDKNKEPCEPDKSFVSIYKVSATEYSYKGHLNCPACKDSTGFCYEETSNSNPPEITVTFPDPAVINNNHLYDDDKNIEIKMDAKGENAKIASYSYKIYVDKRLAFNSGVKRNGKVPTLTINEKLKNYLPGYVKVVVTVTNTDGDTKTVYKNENYEDAVHPSCGLKTYDGNNIMSPPYDNNDDNPNNNAACGQGNYKWLNISSSNKTRHVWVNCDDKQGFGCAQQEFSKGLNTEGETENVVIKDGKGHTASCQVLKCMDFTTPTLIVRLLNGDTEVKKFTVSGQSSVLNYTKAEKYDTWLNKAAFPNGVKIEVTVGDSASRPKSFKWYHNESGQKENAIGATNKKVYENNSISVESLTGAGNFKYDTTIKEDGVRKEVFTVVDRAGNSINYSLILKIDLTEPSCGTVSGGSTTWQNIASRTCSMGCSDAMSGCPNSTFPSTVTDECKTKSISFTVKDTAGNAKDCTGTCNVYIDRTPPTCGSASGGSATWSNAASRTVSVGCNDSLSGCSQNTFSTSVTDETTTKNVAITIQDGVGLTQTCTNPYNIYLDRTPPTIGTVTKTNDNYTLSTTIGDALSGLKTFTWGGQSAQSASGATKSISTNMITSNGNSSISVTDQAGNSASSSITGVYKYCDSTHTPTKSQEFPNCDSKHKYNIKMFRWYDRAKENSQSIKYKTQVFSCNCKMDGKDTKHLCSVSTNNYTICHHTYEYSYIIYDSANHRDKAYDGTIPANSHVNQVCNDRVNSEYSFHSYHFFPGATDGDYNNWYKEVYTIGSKQVVAGSLGDTAACTAACNIKYGP